MYRGKAAANSNKRSSCALDLSKLKILSQGNYNSELRSESSYVRVYANVVQVTLNYQQGVSCNAQLWV